MKKLSSLLLAILMVLTLSVPALGADITKEFEGAAESTSDGERNAYSYSMGEIQTMLLDELKEKGIFLEAGTIEYYSFICEQLLGDTEKALRASPNFRLFHAYMAVYKNAAELMYWTDADTNIALTGEGLLSIATDEDFLKTTIGEIRNKMLAIDMTATAEREAGVSFLSSYDSAAAVAYAREHAENYSDSYKSWTITQGGDCTNFVSQCLYAGGKPMSGTCSSSGKYTDTRDWFHIQFSGLWKSYGYTTTWISCGDFKKFWQGKCTRYDYKTTIPDLIAVCSAGDIVQLCNEDTMVPYHSIIITEKSGNTAKYCGHSYDRLDYDVNGTNLEPTLNDYLIYQF